MGAFNPRDAEMIATALRGGERMPSPLIFQIAQVQLGQYQVTLPSFAEKLWQSATEVKSSFHKHVLLSAV